MFDFQYGMEGGSTKDDALGDGAFLVLERVGKEFAHGNGVRSVLGEISFAVARGEFICILGPSGCGKSTLLKLIAGFLSPSWGRMTMEGQAISGPGRDRCMVFQEDALFPWLTLGENIGFGLGGLSRGERKQKVDEYLDLLGLTGFGDYLPSRSSGGMKQRVALARVLILAPRILLMDEPFAALDAQTRERMQSLLLKLWGHFSQTIIFVTHDVREAVTLADRILVMGKDPGRIIHQVTPKLPRPRREEASGFVQLAAELKQKL